MPRLLAVPEVLLGQDGLVDGGERLVALLVAGAHAHNLDHGMAGVVQAHLDALREADAALCPARPVGLVERGISLQRVGQEVVMPAEIRQLLGTHDGGEARVLLGAEAGDIGEVHPVLGLGAGSGGHGIRRERTCERGHRL